MPIDVTRVAALCFDVDGTLNDTDDQYVERVIPVFKAARLFLPERDFAKAARRFVMWAESPANALFGIPDRFGFDDQVMALASRISQLHKSSIKHFQPISGTRQMLEELMHQYPLAVVSARHTETTQEFLRQAGIEHCFSCVAGALTARHTKPYPDPIIWAAEKLGVSPKNCLMIGDTTVDIRAGKAAGAQTVGVLCGFGEEAELRKQGADEIIKTTAMLTDVLAGHLRSS